MWSFSLIGCLNLNGVYDKICRIKNGHQKDMCYNEVGLCDPNIDTTLGSIVRKVGRTYFFNFF